jgi:Trk-type K+ transport system membrane component
VDSYVRRATKAFSFLWSFFALAVAIVAVLLGITTDPAPDFFIIIYGVISAFGGGVCGFLHGVTLTAARQLDAQNLAEERDGAD